jgi:Zn-dependent metalloprotease
MTRRALPLVLAILFTATSAVAMNGHGTTPHQRQALASFGQNVQIELDGLGVPSWLMGALSARTFADPAAAATDALDLHGAAFRRGADDTFAFRTLISDGQGQTHVRMTQLYRGFPVVGGELIVHMTGDAVVGINGRFVADLALDTSVALSSSQLVGAAEAYTAAAGGLGIGILEVGETVVYAGDDEVAPKTAVRVRLQYTDSLGPQIDDVYVDAHDGRVLGTSPRVFRAKSRKIYNMNQACISTGSEMPGSLMFSEGGSSTDTGAMGAYTGSGST